MYLAISEHNCCQLSPQTKRRGKIHITPWRWGCLCSLEWAEELPNLHLHGLYWQIFIHRLKQEFRRPAHMCKPTWRCLNLVVSILCWILAELDAHYSLSLHTQLGRDVSSFHMKCKELHKACLCMSSPTPWSSFNDNKGPYSCSQM